MERPLRAGSCREPLCCAHPDPEAVGELGAANKTLHNVVGALGVLEGSKRRPARGAPLAVGARRSALLPRAPPPHRGHRGAARCHVPRHRGQGAHGFETWGQGVETVG